MDEFEERYRKQQAYLAEEAVRELAEKASLIDNFRKGCLDKGISLAEEAFSYIPQIGVMATHPGLIAYLDPDLSTDKDGLYDFQQLSQLYSQQRFSPGYLYGAQYMLMAHPYFRRGYHPHAAFPPRFVQLFWQLDVPVIQTFISLDPDRVRINVDNRMYMEKDTWYGQSLIKIFIPFRMPL